MKKYCVHGFGWDFNGTLVNGYPEITLVYMIIINSLFDLKIKKFSKLFFYTQPKCWNLLLKNEWETLYSVFINDIAYKKDFVSHCMENYPFDENLLNKVFRKLPKVGKKIDVRIDKNSVNVVKELYEDKVTNFIYSASFTPLIKNMLHRNRIENYFSEIFANEINDLQVNLTDKSKTFPEALKKLNLNYEATGYIGDSPNDKNIFKLVEFPFVDPKASESFKEECRYDPNFEGRVCVLNDYSEILKSLERKLYF
ncbi:MAG: hypothetical protein DRP13_00700 [Candidatus Aenigmatarchaeota archaeon]|nr:MAG: hypothetical protein DRP13_00700 [Candidatus Aenigmarchaeota archaeon]